MSTTRSISPRAPATERRAKASASLTDCVLVLAAHASSGSDAGREPVHRWARLIARRGLCAAVKVGMLKGAPTLEEAAAAGARRRVLVVPFFLADGYFTRRAIPAALAKVPGRARLHLCPPVGTSPRLAVIVRRAARAACRKHGLTPATTALLLVGHGTRREKSSSQAARALSETLAVGGTFAAVACAFLEEPPSVAEALAAMPGKAVVAIGLFAADGAHGADDVRALLAASRDKRAIHYAGVIGSAPGMADAVVERALLGLEQIRR